MLQGAAKIKKQHCRCVLSNSGRKLVWIRWWRRRIIWGVIRFRVLRKCFLCRPFELVNGWSLSLGSLLCQLLLFCLPSSLGTSLCIKSHIKTNNTYNTTVFVKRLCKDRNSFGLKQAAQCCAQPWWWCRGTAGKTNCDHWPFRPWAFVALPWWFQHHRDRIGLQSHRRPPRCDQSHISTAPQAYSTTSCRKQYRHKLCNILIHCSDSNAVATLSRRS